jgi:predicted MFS family arabinose efflux permease
VLRLEDSHVPTPDYTSADGLVPMHPVAVPRPLRTQVAIIMLVRTVLNTPSRVLYPFLPAIARGLGVSLASATQLVTLRTFAGLLAPLLGPFSDHFGRRQMMEFGLLLFTIAGLALAGVGTVWAAAVAFVLYGLSKAIYDPAVQAHLGDTVVYARRGRAMGFAELSWSAAWLLGVPATGFLMERFGWRSPWSVLIVMGALSVGLTRLGLPSTRGETRAMPGAQLAPAVLMTWKSLLQRRTVIALLATSLLLFAAIELPFIVYGAWLETAFGLSLSVLGVASAVVGLAEAAGELATTVLTDRLGKRRSVLAGLFCLTASLILLPALSRLGLVPALAGVVCMMLSFEFALVSLLPLASEVAPDARASLLAFNVTAASLGRIAAAVAGGWLWRWQSIALHAWSGALCALLAALVLGFGVVECQP